MVTFRKAWAPEDFRWLRWLDAECFPDDRPFEEAGADWHLGFEGNDAVAYCAWKRFGEVGGFHYRSGVLEENRGQGLQKTMLHMRETLMREKKLLYAYTYTEAWSAASMRSLISAGYRPYEMRLANLMCRHDRWRQMVYWQKKL